MTVHRDKDLFTIGNDLHVNESKKISITIEDDHASNTYEHVCKNVKEVY